VDRSSRNAERLEQIEPRLCRPRLERPDELFVERRPIAEALFLRDIVRMLGEISAAERLAERRPLLLPERNIEVAVGCLERSGRRDVGMVVAFLLRHTA